MLRFRLSRLAAPRGAGVLLAACCGLGAVLGAAFGVGFGCVAANAQSATSDPSAQTTQAVPSIAAPYINPFAPQSQAGTKGTVPAWEKFDRPPTRRRQGNSRSDNGRPRTFQRVQTIKPIKPPPSGMGKTGFDASNGAERRRNAPASGTPGNSTSAYGNGSYGNSAYGAQANTATAPQNPYQQPIPPLPAEQARAEAPGQPPVTRINPIRTRTKKRRPHPDEPTDPFAPTGIHAGSFEVFPAIEVLGGYDSNPNSTDGGKGAAVYTVAPELKVDSDWGRHSLKAELRGSYTGYSPDNSPTLSRPYFKGKVDGRIDLTRDTKINLGSNILVSTDNPGSPDLQAGLSKLPLYFTMGHSLGITQSFNRFELKATGDFQRTQYQDSELTDGTTVSNKDRNYNQFGGSLRGSYEMTPGVKPFAEVSADTRRHDQEPDSYGYDRNSNGITGKVGTTFELSRLLTGEISLGYTHRNYDDPRFGSVGGLVGDASLIWTADALNTFKLTASSTVEESSVSGVSGVFYRNVALQYDHAYRRWLIGSLKLGLGVDTYEGGSTSSSTTTVSTISGSVITEPGQTTPNRQDLTYSAGFGLTYKFSRELWLKGQFSQKWVRSNVSGNDYNDSLFLFGIRLQR
ncbi:MAG: outer membrane beta-barrel protein [Pseudolabrys sp.]